MQRRNQLPISQIVNKETANAFLFGVIFNQAQRAERAWQAPYVLKNRIGTLDPIKILKMPSGILLKAVGEKPAVHPFIQKMTKHLIESCETLVYEYDADARGIWTPVRSTTEVIKRFQVFSGIGKHKAVMATFLLTHELGITVHDDGTDLNIRTVCPSLSQLYGE